MKVVLDIPILIPDMVFFVLRIESKVITNKKKKQNGKQRRIS